LLQLLVLFSLRSLRMYFVDDHYNCDLCLGSKLGRRLRRRRRLLWSIQVV
jgi:hypothetical protein